MGITGNVFSILLLCSSCFAISNYLNSNDQSKLKEILLSGLDNDEVAPLDYAVRGLALLGLDIPKKDSVCQKLKAKLETQTTETVFHVGKASSLLGCSLQLSGAQKDKLESLLTASSAVSELYFATGALSTFGVQLDDAKILKALNAALKKDDSIINLGHAFHIAALLKGDVSSISSRVEDAIVQADQVDGKMLQFEGGLSVTAQVISGAYNLAKTVGKAPSINKDQANKFAEYFVSRKSVQTVKGVFHLLEVASVLAENPFHLPVAITLASKASVSKSEPKFQVKVSNILGKNIESVNVVADSATRTLDDAVVLSQKQLTPKNGMFELDLMSSNPGKGVYKVVLSAAAGDDSRLVGNVGALVEVKVLTKIAVEETEIGTADADQSTAAKLKKINFPQKLDGVLEADSHQKLLLKFVLRDTLSKDLVTVHQAFVRLTHRESHQEIFFVAEPDVNDAYKFDLDLAAKAKDFLYQSGLYSMDLIIGDAVIENPTVYQVAELRLSFTPGGASQKSPKTAEMYLMKPEIKHMFREPEVRPPSVVSSTFTLLVVVPLVMFLVLVARLGMNFSAASLSMSALGFHLSIGAIFGLFICFWLYLNMFQTLKWLAILSLPAFVSGNYMLTDIASKRGNAAKQQN
nr:EOG090X04WQ [Scapholeberis mucronata]